MLSFCQYIKHTFVSGFQVVIVSKPVDVFGLVLSIIKYDIALLVDFRYYRLYQRCHWNVLESKNCHFQNLLVFLWNDLRLKGYCLLLFINVPVLILKTLFSVRSWRFLKMSWQVQDQYNVKNTYEPWNYSLPWFFLYLLFYTHHFLYFWSFCFFSLLYNPKMYRWCEDHPCFV